MADTKISALTAASVAALANEFAINEAGASKKLTLQKALDGVDLLASAAALADANKLLVIQSSVAKAGALTDLVTYLQTKGMPKVMHLGSQYTNNSTTGTSVTGLKFASLVTGTYHVRWILICQSAATTTSPKFGVNYTGTTTKLIAHARFPSEGVTAATGQIQSAVNATTGQVWAYASTLTASTTAPNLGPWTGVTTNNANMMIIVEATVVTGGAGDLELWAGSEVGSSQITCEVGSVGILTRAN